MGTLWTQPFIQLPTVNFEAPINADDLQFLTGTYTDEFLNRMQILCGGYRTSGFAYGIVDQENPAVISDSDVNRPLQVSINTANPQAIDIQAGFAVTQQGQIIQVLSPVTNVNVAGTYGAPLVANASYVVFVEYFLNPSTDLRVSNFGTELVPTDYIRPPAAQVIEVAGIADITNLNLFSLQRQQNIVVIAIITSNGSALSLDLTQQAYSINRPWFSPVDIQHRTQLGTGLVTQNNPHGTSINDLTAAGLSFYDQLIDGGKIIAKGESIPVIPGVRCRELVLSLSSDDTGYLTSNSIYGGPGAQYTLLSSYPIRLGAAYPAQDILVVTNSGQPTSDMPVVRADYYPLAVDLIPETNILVFGPQQVNAAIQQWNGAFYVEYFSVNALSFSVTVTSDISFAGVETTEIVITEGVVISELNGSASFTNLGNFPKRYDIYATKDSSPLVAPQVVTYPTVLSSLTGSNNSFDVPIISPANVLVGLTGAAPYPSLTIQLNGNDLDGVSTSEIVSISSNSWSDVSGVTSDENPNQFISSLTAFSSLTSWSVITNVTNNVGAQVIMLADLKPVAISLGTNGQEANENQTTRLADMPKIASVFWNTQSINPIGTISTIPKDTRNPVTSLAAPTIYKQNQPQVPNSMYLLSILANIPSDSLQVPIAPQILIHEDLRNPYYLDSRTTDPYGFNGLAVSSNISSQVNANTTYNLRKCYRSRAVLLSPTDGQPQSTYMSSSFFVVTYGVYDPNLQIILHYFEPDRFWQWDWNGTFGAPGPEQTGVFRSYYTTPYCQAYSLATIGSQSPFNVSKVFLEIFGKCEAFTLLYIPPALLP